MRWGGGAVAEIHAQDDLTMGRAAVAYAERFHWAVFPLWEIAADGQCACPKRAQCGSPGKHPRTEHGFRDATKDPTEVRRIWGRTPRANIGIATGASGLVVLDIDPRNGGDGALAGLEHHHGRLPDTCRALTGGGGVHYVYCRPEGAPKVKGAPLARGVDVKADGGYIVAAPSGHISGKRYAWEVTAHPTDVVPQALPAWALERLVVAATAYIPSASGPTEGFLGAAFQAAGWMLRSLGPDKAAVRCPWEDEHSGGARGDSSTIVYAPGPGQRFGAFWCAHEHCRARTRTDVLGILPEGAKIAARVALGLEDAFERSPEAVGSGGPPDVPPPSEEWQRMLTRTKACAVSRDPGNLALLLSNLPEWRDCLQYDAFADEMWWVRPVPVLPGLLAPGPGEPLREHHEGYVQHWFRRFRAAGFTEKAVKAALVLLARKNTVHPLQSYLHGLTWDRTPRLGRWLHLYLSAAADDYTSHVGTWWMVSAVARALRPGCQADHLLILEGGQGEGKSTALRTLAGDWYLGTLPDLRSKDAPHTLQGHWIVEIGELDAFRGASGTRVKDWVTQTTDVYRPAWGHYVLTRPRGCVFAGTTNEANYLRDATGARRFWPVRVGRLDRDALARDRDQLWAEARVALDESVPWWPSDAASAMVTTAQEERFDEDAWEGRIAQYVGEHDHHGVTVADVLQVALGLEAKDWGRDQQSRVAHILRRLDWIQHGRRAGSRTRLWMPRIYAGRGS